MFDEVTHRVGVARGERALARTRPAATSHEAAVVAAVVPLLRARVWLPPSRAAVAVTAIAHVLRQLDAAALARVVAGLSHAELRAWHRLLHAAPAHLRDDTHLLVGEQVPLPVWRRFGRWTDDIDPDPSGDLRDLARLPDALPDEVAAQVRHWATWDGPLAARGEGDDHAYAANDVLQGHIGNCYLVAALQAIADVDPWRLARLCRSNANGTWTVTVPSGRRTVVSPDIVVDVHGDAVFARHPPRGEAELWPLLLEKAYAQLHGGWREIVTGHAHDAVEFFTGVRGHVVAGTDLDIAYLAAWRRSRATMVAGTIPVPPGQDARTWLATAAPAPFRWPGGELDRLHPGHAFLVRDVDEAAGTVTLHNPWGIDDGAVVLEEEHVRTCIGSLHVTELE